jgi:hypothetical protein
VPGRSRLVAILVVAFVTALATHGATAVTADVPVPNPYFRAVLPLVRAKTRVPVFLPTTVVWDARAFGPLSVELDVADKSRYVVNFVTDPKCDDHAICTSGYLSSVPALGKIDVSNFKSTEVVVLQNGARAIAGIPIYRLATSITWDWKGRRYYIALGVPHYPADLVRMANSMTRY